MNVRLTLSVTLKTTRLLIALLAFTHIKAVSQVVGSLAYKDTIRTKNAETITWIDTTTHIKLNLSASPKATIFFRPYLVNVSAPCNEQSPTYLNFVAKAAALNKTAFNKLKDDYKRNAKERKLISSLITNGGDLENCKLEQQLVYYLTPNIVNYKIGNNIKNYFTLDTSRITYRLMSGSSLVILVNYKNRKYDGLCIPHADLRASYQLAQAHTKNPLAFINLIKTNPQQRESLSQFGYIGAQGQLIFAVETRRQSRVITTDANPGEKITTLIHKKILAADAYFSDLHTQQPMLNQYIAIAVEGLEK